jgi:ribonuclease P protein component
VPGSPTKPRLSKARFEEVYSKGKRVSEALCRVASLPGCGAVGFAVAKSLGCIARRNRFRRRFREALRIQRHIVDPRFDYVVTILGAAEAASFADVERALASAFVKLNARWESESA